MAKVVLSTVGQLLAQEKITAQLALIATLIPDTLEHEAATRILFLLQDALELLTRLEVAISGL